MVKTERDRGSGPRSDDPRRSTSTTDETSTRDLTIPSCLSGPTTFKMSFIHLHLSCPRPRGKGSCGLRSTSTWPNGMHGACRSTSTWAACFSVASLGWLGMRALPGVGENMLCYVKCYVWTWRGGPWGWTSSSRKNEGSPFLLGRLARCRESHTSR